MCSIYGWSASEGTQSEMLQDLWESREESVGPGESHASSSVLLISFAMLAITTNEAMRAEMREFSRGAKIRFHRFSPALQAIVHVKSGWIESRDPSIEHREEQVLHSGRFSGCC